MALVDGCHSSNIFDLPYTCGSDQTKQKRKKGFNMSAVTQACRPLSAKERYLKEKAARKAEKATKKAAETALDDTKQQQEEEPAYVTKDAQGNTVIMGSPTPEQLAEIQQQMLAEAQAEAMSKMSLAPGQTVQFQVVPGATAIRPGRHTTTSTDGVVTTMTTTVSRSVMGYK